MMTQGPVLVVDDDSLMRAALRRIFVAAEMPVETFASAREFLVEWQARMPGVLLLDVNMPDMTGLQLQSLLNERGSTLPIVFLTGSADIHMAVEAMRNGALDFIEKPFDNVTLVTRVRRAMAQRAPVPVRPASAASDEQMRRLSTLTPREREIFEQMVTGKTSKVIARDVGGSFRTIEIHRSRVMFKMDAANLADLVRMALNCGIAA